ncbi:MAG: hypothetical protein Q8N13_21475 [Acidovorax sp.]|nr:hypothetical protein [Acidovorax sp.]
MSRIRKLLALSTVLLMLAGCALPPATQPRAAAPMDFALQHGLQLQVSPWVDMMPRVAKEYETPSCANLIVSFSIRAGTDGFPPDLEVSSVRLTKLGVAGMGVRELLLDWDALIHHSSIPRWAETRFSGHVVDAKVRETYLIETLSSAKDWSSNRAAVSGGWVPRSWFKERTFRGVATGCPPLGWDPGDTLEVVLQLRAGTQRATLRSTGLYGAAS